ncbi:MAG: hypothetical protein JWM90_1201, partial [Thermoleophilia bacterium]|nr:hypothetical protein [Thermoleophilia bacterium]
GRQIEEWMTAGAHGQISIVGPRDLVLDVRLERWQDEDRALALHPSGQSTDLFVTWRDLSAATIAGGPFGEHFGDKLNKAQAGGAEAGVLRALVLDLSLSDTTDYASFVQEPFVSKLGSVVADLIDMNKPPYELILPSILHRDPVSIGLVATRLVDAQERDTARLLREIDDGVAAASQGAT